MPLCRKFSVCQVLAGHCSIFVCIYKWAGIRGDNTENNKAKTLNGLGKLMYTYAYTNLNNYTPANGVKDAYTRKQQLTPVNNQHSHWLLRRLRASHAKELCYYTNTHMPVPVCRCVWAFQKRHKFVIIPKQSRIGYHMAIGFANSLTGHN